MRLLEHTVDVVGGDDEAQVGVVDLDALAVGNRKVDEPFVKPEVKPVWAQLLDFLLC